MFLACSLEVLFEILLSGLMRTSLAFLFEDVVIEVLEALSELIVRSWWNVNPIA